MLPFPNSCCFLTVFDGSNVVRFGLVHVGGLPKEGVLLLTVGSVEAPGVILVQHRDRIIHLYVVRYGDCIHFFVPC